MGRFPQTIFQFGKPIEYVEHLPGGWRVRVWISGQSGQPIIEDLRIESDRAEDELTPVGGVNSRVLRNIHPDKIIRRALAEAASSQMMTVTAAAVGIDVAQPPRRYRRPGRAGHGDRHFAQWAGHYVDAIARGSRRPVADLAAQHRVPRSWVRDTIHECRRRDMLTDPPGQGQAGGELTGKAQDILAESSDSESEAAE